MKSVGYVTPEVAQSNYETFRGLVAKAHKSLAKAIEADETKAAKRAVMALYRMAIRDVSSALNIRTANCPQSKAREIEGQRQKLESHLKLTQGRMADLELKMVSTRRMCVKPNEVSLSETRSIAVKQRWEYNEQRNQATNMASEQAKKAGKIRLLKRADEKRLEAESREQLSAKRKQAAFKRWGDSDKKRKQRVDATAKTRRKEPLRKSVSTQADLTSAVIEKLHSEKNMLINRLTDPKRRLSTPRKPLNEIGRTASLSRIEGIASAFRGNKNRALSFKEYEEASRKVRRRLGILSPAREANETMPKLTPLEDFKICAGRFNGKERRYLKSDLQKINKDFLAPTDKVCALKKKLSSILQVQSSVEKEIPTVWLNNVPEVLSDRLNRLHENGKLDFSGEFDEKLYLCIVGDKGGKNTKLGISIGNVDKPNSADALLLICIYDAEDNYSNLAMVASKVFDQLRFSEVKICGIQREVIWYSTLFFTFAIFFCFRYITGDLKFLSSVFGHLGAASTHPCLFCEASKVLLREDADYPLRTLWSIENGSLSYVFSGGDSLPAKDKAALRRKVCSIVKEPLIQVPPSNIVPPSLHLIQGLAQKLIEWIEEVDEALVPALETIYKELGADKQAWYQTFTGNHVKKILSGVGPEKIANVISGHPIHSTFRKLLSLLGKMQCLAKSAFLSDEEIGQFEGWSEDYFRCMKEELPDKPITPKCHILCKHVVQFMRSHRFWGVLSEQSIEAFHRKINKDERRFSSVRNREEQLRKFLRESYLRNVLFDFERIVE